MDLERAFAKHVTKMALWPAGARLLVAVSGGVDSVVLLTLLTKLAPVLGVTVGVVHINHQLRPEAAEEAQFVEALCRKLAVPCHVVVWQAGPVMQQNIEKQARDFRYQTFLEIARKADYAWLVTGHHGDDQTETLLMKLMKGSLWRNLVGIAAKRDWQGLTIVRPLLPFSKHMLQEYADQQQLAYREDASNQSLAFFRNRVRHQIIPEMRKESPKLSQHFQHFASQIAYTNSVIDEIVALDQADLLILQTENEVIWDLTKWQKLTPAHQYFGMQAFLQTTLIADGCAINEEKMALVLTVLKTDQPNQHLDLGRGWSLEKSYTTATISKKMAIGTGTADETSIVLAVPGKYQLSDSEWLVLEKAPFREPAQGVVCPLPLELAWPLRLRHPKAGDRLELKGGQHKKVRRLLIDEKVPQPLRKKIWLVETALGEVLWVLPLKKSHLCIPIETAKIQYRLLYLKNTE